MANRLVNAPKQKYQLLGGTDVWLTDQELRYAQYILMGFALADARVKAGYVDYTKEPTYLQQQQAKGRKNPVATGKRKNEALANMVLKKNPDILRYVEDQRSALTNKLKLGTEQLMKFSAAVLSVDIADAYIGQRDVYNRLMKIPEHVRITIKQVVVKRNKEGVITDLDFMFYDKVKIVEMLCKLQELKGNISDTSVKLGGR